MRKRLICSVAAVAAAVAVGEEPLGGASFQEIAERAVRAAAEKAARDQADWENLARGAAEKAAKEAETAFDAFLAKEDER